MSKKLCFLLLIFTLAFGTQLQPACAGTTETLLQLSDDGMEELYGSEEFVSIATGSSKPAYKAPAVASVITSRQIEAMGATTLDEVLERVPGLHVGLSTQGRLDSVYSIRGIHTKFNPQVLLLMNGISFPSFTGGRPLQFRLPVAAIERIEVIRGPGSAVYGADAYAGVINIITKDNQDINGTVLGTRHGSFETHNSWLQHGGSYAGWDLAFSIEQQQSAGDSDRRIGSDLQTALDGNFGTSASKAPGALDSRYRLVDTHLQIARGNWKFRHWYWHQDDAGMGAGAALALDPSGGEDSDQHLADLSWQSDQLLKNWDLGVNLNYLHHRSESRFNLLPAGTIAPIGSDGNLNFVTPAGPVLFLDGMIGEPDGTAQQYGSDLTALYRGFSSHQLRFATGFKYYEVRITSEKKNFGHGSPLDGSMTQVAGTPYVFLPDSDRTVTYLSIQDEWNFAPDWELTAGVRMDSYSDFGETLNPRLALVWATRHNLTTKFLYGRAFRAPSFSELYSINNPVALGNPQLDPETIDTLELAFDYRLTFDLQTNLSFFYYQADDLIEFVPDSSGGTATARNARDQKGYGLEFEVLWQATPSLKLQGNYALQRSEDVATGKTIADAPGQQLYLSANWKFLPDWSVETQLNWVADRKRAAGDTRSQIDDYSIVDLTLRRNNIFKGFDVSVAAKNLFDQDAYEPSRAGIPGFTDDYPLAGRSLWAQISYRF